MMRLRAMQRGETIMEVLICVAIVGFMMTAAFTLSNENQATARASYERNMGVKVGETQLEKLRFYADRFDLPTTTDTGGKPFCINDNANSTQSVIVFDNSPSINPDADTDVAKYTGKKSGTTDAANCYDAASAGKYRYAVWPPGTASTRTSNYLVTVRWESVTGSNIDNIEFYYEVYNTSNPLYRAGGPVPACRDGIDNDGDNSPAHPSHSKGGIDYPADKGCTSPDDPDETNPACSDAINNDMAEDSDIDHPADPGCTGPEDTDEADPPEIAGFPAVTRSGSNYIDDSCVSAETVVGDGADGCFKLGGSMYARRDVRLSYDMTVAARPGVVRLEIKYQEYGDPTPAPVGYSYQVKLMGGGVDTTLNLPAAAPGSEQTFTRNITFTSAPQTLTIEWLNNAGSPGGDPDLQINSIKLARP